MKNNDEKKPEIKYCPICKKAMEYKDFHGMDRYYCIERHYVLSMPKDYKDRLKKLV